MTTKLKTTIINEVEYYQKEYIAEGLFTMQCVTPSRDRHKGHYIHDRNILILRKTKNWVLANIYIDQSGLKAQHRKCGK